MTQEEKRTYLIEELLKEQPEYRDIEIPQNEQEKKRLLRSLFNIRMPQTVSRKFLEVQDAYLQTSIIEKGITELADLQPIQKELYLWQGDITTFHCDAIVNAANAQMLGCFCPCHGCIDNCIHTYAGIQLRLKCAELMQTQGHKEATGQAKITPAYNLPCDYVIHTVGPIVQSRVTKKDEDLLASCYRNCLEIADANGVKSVAFCCISTGVFMFPNQRAAEIAVATVKDYKEKTKSSIKVIFNVFKDLDKNIYMELLR